jgi:hypothetical protein
MRRSLFIPVLVAAVSGCGGAPRIDTTSAKTLKESKDAVKADMGQVEKRQFEIDCTTVMSGAAPTMIAPAGKGAAAAPPPVSPEVANKRLHGKTAAEIHQEAEDIRAGKKKN